MEIYDPAQNLALQRALTVRLSEPSCVEKMRAVYRRTVGRQLAAKTAHEVVIVRATYDDGSGGVTPGVAVSTALMDLSPTAELAVSGRPGGADLLRQVRGATLATKLRPPVEVEGPDGAPVRAPGAFVVVGVYSAATTGGRDVGFCTLVVTAEDDGTAEAPSAEGDR